MIRHANQFFLGQVDLETMWSQMEQAIQRDIEERALKEIELKITEEMHKRRDDQMIYTTHSDEITVPSMVRMFDPVSGKLVAEFPYSEGCPPAGSWSTTINCWDSYRRLANATAAVDEWALRLHGGERPTEDIEPTCSVRELLEQTREEKDDKMGTVF